jgi:hypothetical protein
MNIGVGDRRRSLRNADLIQAANHVAGGIEPPAELR